MDSVSKHFAELFGVASSGEPTPELKARQGRNADESLRFGREALEDGHALLAIEHFKRAMEQRGEPVVEDALALGAGYEFADMEGEALETYVQSAEIDEQSGEPMIGIADIHQRQSDRHSALMDLEQALLREPNNAQFLYKYSKTQRELGHLKPAEEAAKRAIENAPDQAFFYAWLAEVQMHGKQFDAAIKSLRAAVELSPGDDFLLVRSSVAFWHAGRKPEAVKAIRLAGDLDPDKAVYLGILYMLLRAIGDEEEADSMQQKVAALDQYDRDYLTRMRREFGI